MKAIIPTGGRGTRLQPLTFSSNKHFIPVANKPLIFYPVETVAEVGIKEVAITYNPGGLEIAKSYLGDGSHWGMKFTYILQEKPVGVANIVEVCKEFVGGDSFVLHLGDNIFNEGIKETVNYFLKEKPNGLVTMIKHKENRRMGVPYFDKKGRLVKYVEKPENPPHQYAVPGLYFGDKNFFKVFEGKNRIGPSVRGEYEMPLAYQWLIDHGFRIEVVKYEGKWMDPGKFDDWIEANQYILDHKLETKVESKVDRGVILENRVRIGKRCEIKNSQVRGPVVIGDDVVLKNSYIGPFTSIGDGSVIEGSHVENSVVMSGVRISNIDQPIDTSLIGTGSQVLNSHGPTRALRFFIGEKSQVKI